MATQGHNVPEQACNDVRLTCCCVSRTRCWSMAEADMTCGSRSHGNRSNAVHDMHWHVTVGWLHRQLMVPRVPHLRHAMHANTPVAGSGLTTMSSASSGGTWKSSSMPSKLRARDGARARSRPRSKDETDMLRSMAAQAVVLSQVGLGV